MTWAPGEIVEGEHCIGVCPSDVTLLPHVQQGYM